MAADEVRPTESQKEMNLALSSSSIREVNVESAIILPPSTLDGISIRQIEDKCKQKYTRVTQKA